MIGATELTWEEKNSADYRYYPEDDSKLLEFIEQNKKELDKNKLTEKVNRIMKYTDWLWKHLGLKYKGD